MNLSLSLLFESRFGRTENENEDDYRRNLGSSIFGETMVSCQHFNFCYKLNRLKVFGSFWTTYVGVTFYRGRLIQNFSTEEMDIAENGT